MKMNLPNKLTVLRLCMVPAIIIVLLLPVTWITNVLGALIFLAASLTDMFDGKIARKRGLITDFGKFLDPLADKFMVIAAIMAIIYRSADNKLIFNIFMPLLIITVFRELAVASIRLVASTTAGVVVAANMLGKIKTVSQIVCIMAVLLEPVLGLAITYFFPSFNIFSYYPVTCASALVTLVFTVWSGVVYIRSYWKYLDPEK